MAFVKKRKKVASFNRIQYDNNMTYNELNNLVMPPAKRQAEKTNFWVALIVRPLSVLFTLPFVNSKVSPTTITKISEVIVIAGAFFLMLWPTSMIIKLVGWFLFFIWAVLDGVDGNLARATNQCSSLGELWDAIGGYSAMVLLYFSAGVVAFYDTNLFTFWDPYVFLIIGGATSLFSIFPRLVLHKKEVIYHGDKTAKELRDKKNFSLSKVVAMNFLSVSGFLQVLYLLCILTHTVNCFILFYCLVNLLMMIISIYKMVKE